MDGVRHVAAAAGAYLCGSVFFRADRQRDAWRDHDARLKAIGRHREPQGPFSMLHAVGSESRSTEGSLPCDLEPPS
jgi:hypothetical protein